MRLRECLGHPVLDTSTATTIARIDGLVVDPAQRRIAAIRLRGAGRKPIYLLWEDLDAFGPDAVTVASAEVLRRLENGALPYPELESIGRRVLTEAGDELGTVEDLEFDPSSGAVEAVFTQSDQIDGKRILGLGAYALVVAKPEHAPVLPTDRPPG